MKILSTTWTPLPEGFEATTMTATDAHIILGGEEGALYRTRFDADEPLEFVPISFPEGLKYYDLWEVPLEETGIDVALTDWSVQPPQVSLNLGEYQGGSYGIWVMQGDDLDHGALLPTPHDSDIGFAKCYVLREDMLLAESYQDVHHFERVDGVWREHLVAIPTTTRDFEILDMALSHDGETLAVVTFEHEVGTMIFELRAGRFEYARSLDLYSSYISCHAHHTLTLDYRTPRLFIWDAPMCGAEVSRREVPLPDDFVTYCGNDEFIGIISREKLELLTCDALERVAVIPLPAIKHKYAPTQVAFVDERLVVLCQHQLGVIVFDEVVPPSKPRAPGAQAPRTEGYARAREIFAKFAGHDLSLNAPRILEQLVRLTQDPAARESTGWWLWRGWREGRIGLDAAFSRALASVPDAYDAADVIAFMRAIDHESLNAYAWSYEMVRAKLEGHEALFVMYWATSRGVLRADLGYELAKRRLVPVRALPARALERATSDLARCHLCGPRDVSYSSRLRDLQRLYSTPEIARGVIRAALDEEHLGMGLTQWFEMVWPHIMTHERVALLFKVNQEALVLWYVDRFEAHGLEPDVREQMLDELSRLLVIEPTVNMFSPSIRPYAPYTFLLAALLLGQDAAARRTGLGPVGGSTFVRALELADRFPNMCGLTPPLEERVRAIFGNM